MNLGGNAPGLVFENLLNGLSNNHEIDVYTAENKLTIELSKVKNIYAVPYFTVHPRIKKFMLGLLKFDIFDIIWSLLVRRKINSEIRYDLVFSFISFHHNAALSTGYKLYKKMNIYKWAVYSVDAIPAPLGWSNDDLYYRSTKKIMGKYLAHTDYFFSSNEQMLKYQETTFTKKKNSKQGVIYCPSSTKMKYFDKSDELIFLYTGGIYGLRKVKSLFKGLKLILKDHPAVKIYFVGSRISDTDLSILDKDERKSIHLFPYTSNLEVFYRQAYALIDIDADTTNDVFLSSKITNYININRPILAISGLNSPSRNIFDAIDSIICVNHDEYDIYRGMKRIIEKPSYDFSDRSRVIELFDVNFISKQLNKVIS